MPVYEFLCLECRRRTSLFVRSRSQSATPVCEHCGSRQLQRLISSFAYHKSIQTVWEESGDPMSPGPDYYRDPRNIGRWAEKRLEQMGVEMPSSVRHMIDAAREGEMPPPLKD